MTSATKPAEGLLKTGQNIHVTVDREDDSLAFFGTIAEISQRYIAVAFDINVRDFLSAPHFGMMLQCAVNGDGCVYRFSAAFRSSSALPEKIWFLEKPETVNRIQMRRFVRVPMALPMQVKLPGAHGSFRNSIEATLVDISGGGICFAHHDKVLLQSRIAINIPDLPLYGTLQVDAIVERCTPIEIPSGRVFHVGASLENSLTVRQQDKLIKSVFQLQRLYLKKGLRIPQLDHTKPRNKN